MPESDRSTYYRRRHQKQRNLAAQAASPAIAAIHNQLADAYQRIANGSDGETQTAEERE